MKAKKLLAVLCLYGLLGSAWGEPAVHRKLPVCTVLPSVQIIELEKTASTIPTEAIRPFLVYPRVVSKEVLENAPYIVAGTEGRLILGAGDEVYVRGLSDTLPTQYGLYRVGSAYRNPEHPKEVLGYEALFIANVEVKQFGDPARAYIQSSTREVMAGDRLLPRIDRELKPRFSPHAASVPVEGKIIAFVGGGTLIAQNEVVALNLGAEDGIERGAVLGIYQPDRGALNTINYQPGDWARLPAERAGTIMIFRVFDRISYALVMKAREPIRLYDAVRNP